MAQSIIQDPTSETKPSNQSATTSRLRTVTGNRFPPKCTCGCGFAIPRDPEVRYVVDFGAAKPYPADLREHSPDYGSIYNHGRPRAREDARTTLPEFTPASELPLPRPPSPAKPPAAPRPTIEVAPEDAEATPSPEAGRGWAFSQLVFSPGSFESVRAGFASYARGGRNTARPPYAGPFNRARRRGTAGDGAGAPRETA